MRMLTLLALCLALLSVAFGQVDPQTPLQAYVNKPDSSYSWKLIASYPGVDWDTHVLNLTSQTWLSPQDSNIYTWWHYFQICVPKKVVRGSFVEAGIYADGGPDNSDGPPHGADETAGILASKTGVIVGHLYDIPNQPAYFTAEHPRHRRVEDAVIAYTWSHFLNNTNQPEWLLRLPMVKSVVRAMDCLSEFSQQLGHGPVNKYLIAGASKRGWTTWLTPVVDKRVVAIVPIVMPVLNMQTVIGHLWQSLGQWSFALDDYLAMNLMQQLNSDAFTKMAQIIDPFVYKATMARIPKYLLIGSNDEFFIPDAPRDFWKNLPGDNNHLRVIPNAEHAMIGHAYRIFEQVATYIHLLNAKQVPEPLDYTLVYSNTTASITVRPKMKPSVVTLFQASTWSTTMRDFRFITCKEISNPKCFSPVFWLPTTLQPATDGSYTASIDAPSSGWIGFLIEVTYQDPNNENIWMEVTSEVNIVPDRYPFPPCGPHTGGC